MVDLTDASTPESLTNKLVRRGVGMKQTAIQCAQRIREEEMTKVGIKMITVRKGYAISAAVAAGLYIFPSAAAQPGRAGPNIPHPQRSPRCSH